MRRNSYFILSPLTGMGNQICPKCQGKEKDICDSCDGQGVKSWIVRKR